MGSRGRKPTPMAILKARGSWRGDIKRNEPTPAAGLPICPRWLPAKAKQEWKRIAPLLESMKVLTKADGNALVRYCVLLAQWREMIEFVEERTMGGAFMMPVKKWNKVKDEFEAVAWKPMPQMQMADAIATQLGRLEQSFGLTPSARSRIEVSKEKDESSEDARVLRLGRVS